MDSYETCLLSDHHFMDERPELQLMSLCNRLVKNEQKCNGRNLRKLAFPALKEIVKMNKKKISLSDFINLLNENIIQAER